jgi:tetratricopeptide (TPR) repeat protein
MSVDLLERYRDALRRGHVAAARGRLEEAAAAYAEAIALAPDRPVAHAGLAIVYLARGDARAALAEADIALARAPRDEGALTSRAEALSRLGRRIEAAETLDRLSDLQNAAGRDVDALTTARRALGLAEQKTRRRHVEALTARLAPVLADAGAQTGERPDLPGQRVAGPAGAPAPSDAGAAFEPARVPEPEQIPDGSLLLAAAEAAYDAGDRDAARRGALAAADAFGRAGHVAAAIDACSVALTIAPDDPDLHLALVELYLDRGWRSHAAQKLALLGRLADLDSDVTAHARLCAIISAEFADHPELTALCA